MPSSSWCAFSTQIGMSLVEPGSEESTANTLPTGALLTLRISSINGPGQKLPRASISLSMCIDLVVSIVPSASGQPDTSALPALVLDEETDLGVLGAEEEPDHAD